jgi:hypothetical protein
VALDTKAMAPSDLAQVIVDTTVQQGGAREFPVRIAKNHGADLR